MRLSKRLIGAAVAVILAGGVFGGLGAGTLSISGNSVPTNFVTQNGRVYVPLADVAKALNMSLSKSSANNYALAPAGGANQVQGLAGRVGQVLNCGYATLELVKVTVTDRYDYQFSTGNDTPNNANEQLYVVHLRVKNATTRTVFIGYGGTDHSALVDSDDHSYQSLSGPGARDLPGGNELLPGSAKDFALAFSVPKNETPTQLIYGVYFYQVPAKDLKDFRINLKP